MSKKTLIFAATYNESENIKLFLDKILSLKIDLDAKGYTFFMETIFNLIQNGYIIKQIPIIFKDRSYGYSKIPKNEIYRTLKKLFEYKQKKNNV